MYESPIKIIQGQIQTQLEGDILRVIQNQHIEVDRDELVMALKCDREQYEKGYNDARREYEEKLDKIVEQLEERIDFHIRLVDYEMNMGTITDVERNRGAIKATEKAITIVKGEQYDR